MPSGWQRFTILEHDHPFLHWDLLLDNGQTLTTWRLKQRPCSDEWIAAERLPDHRRIYLDYEGPVSGGRGAVSRLLTARYCAAGDMALLSSQEPRESQIELAECWLGRRAVCRAGGDGLQWRFES
ncbi:MAG: hypothetical protein NXI04_21895 [Planctomycetaceae bacterium]|nr:hypothetical protein [Planctomycetaceae bacterium]